MLELFPHIVCTLLRLALFCYKTGFPHNLIKILINAPLFIHLYNFVGVIIIQVERNAGIAAITGIHINSLNIIFIMLLCNQSYLQLKLVPKVNR